MRWICLFACSLSLLAEEPPKPADSIVAAYFKADAAVGAARAQHDALMEQIKKQIADSVARQVDATIKAVVASSQLQAACGSNFELDLKLLQTGEVKCVEKAPAK